MTSPTAPADDQIRLPVDPNILNALRDAELNRVRDENMQLRAVIETVAQGAQRHGLSLAQLCAAPAPEGHQTNPDPRVANGTPGWAHKEVLDEAPERNGAPSV
jgi:hypothetical protein